MDSLATPLRLGQIYGLLDPRDGLLRYVGQTIQPLKLRLLDHCKGNYPCRKTSWVKSLKKLGLRPRIVPLESEIHPSLLNESEAAWIAIARATGATLLNHTDGGGFENRSPESNAKIAAKLRGRKRPAHVIAILRASNLGRKATPEARANMSKAQLGRKHSEETKAKISLGNRLVIKKPLPPLTEAHKQKLRDHLRRVRFERSPASGIRYISPDRGKWRVRFPQPDGSCVYGGKYDTIEAARRVLEAGRRPSQALSLFDREYAKAN